MGYRSQRKEIKKISKTIRLLLYGPVPISIDNYNYKGYDSLIKEFPFIEGIRIVRAARKLLYTYDYDTIIFKLEELILNNV